MSETRTISHLLHPSLIDELGFPAAAKWYAEGFSERSGIEVNLELSNQSQRLPRTVELPLFRILQASLSNVHRHTKSPTVDVRFAITQSEARLEVKDYGKGIGPELLRQFKQSGGGAGIGLAGCVSACENWKEGWKSNLMPVVLWSGRSFLFLEPSKRRSQEAPEIPHKSPLITGHSHAGR